MESMKRHGQERYLGEGEEETRRRGDTDREKSERQRQEGGTDREKGDSDLRRDRQRSDNQSRRGRDRREEGGCRIAGEMYHVFQLSVNSFLWDRNLM